MRITGTATRDLLGVLEWTVQEFGVEASLRYDALIKQALKDIVADPERPGSRERPDLTIEGARTYHISLSRTRVAGARVKEPRHFILYRSQDGAIEVARILHDSRDLALHLPAGYRRIDTGN